tara:strand:+ start:6600 stop:7208 length:609 start_codon:yes stop_codon:yes gene_type:complete
MKTNFILDKSLTQPLLDWILNEDNRKTHITEEPEHGGHVVARDYLHMPDDELLEANFPYSELMEIGDVIMKQFDLPMSTQIEPNYGYLICHSQKGHQVHEHSDANFNVEGPDELLNEDLPYDYLGDVIHTRFNVLISKPLKGGNPVINKIEYKVKENEVWRCLAGIHDHYTTKVEKDKPRVLLSFGYFIDKDYALNQGWYEE